jgi:hypothetical protein
MKYNKENLKKELYSAIHQLPVLILFTHVLLIEGLGEQFP